jgi:hypothetical protein
MQTSERTAELIQHLTADVRPISSQALVRRLFAGLVVGIAIALLVLLLSVGVRADLRTAVFTVPFWMKWLYAGSLSVIGFGWCVRLARPDAKSITLPWWMLVPVALLLLLSLYELRYAPAEAVHKLWMGHSALICPFNIMGFALPVFVSVALMLRRLAPTRLRLAGFAAGCVAGASGAVVYALYCNESAAPFVLVWYSVGMVLPALVGAALGPRLLRW